MNNTTVNVTTSEASTSSFIGLIESLEICLQSFGLFFGLPTHFFVLWLIVTESRTILPSEFFILNLCVCEIINCVNCLVLILSAWFLTLIKLAQFLSGLGLTCRPVFECLICVERYLAVVHPVTFLKYKPLRYRVICSAAAWITSLASCLFCMFSSILQDFVGHSWFFLVQFLIFLSIQLFCCLAVLRGLKQSGPGERGREREEINHMKRRAFYLILISTVSMVLINVPIILTGVFYILLHQAYTRAVWFFSSVCYVLAGFVQSALYLYRAGKLPCFCSPKTRGKC